MNSEERKVLLEQLEQTKQSLFATLEKVNDTLFLDKPPNDGWSIAELVEHIILVDKSILKGIHKFGETPREDPIITSFDDEGLLKRVTSRDRKVEAPKYFVPKGIFTNKQEAIKAFEAHYEGIYEFINSTALPLRKIGFPHAIFGVLNGVNWLTFIGGHEDRHIEQMEEIIESHKIL